MNKGERDGDGGSGGGFGPRQGPALAPWRLGLRRPRRASVWSLGFSGKRIKQHTLRQGRSICRRKARRVRKTCLRGIFGPPGYLTRFQHSKARVVPSGPPKGPVFPPLDSFYPYSPRAMRTTLPLLL